MRWYRSNGRHHLAWRTTRDPYAILVSEVMLQQTQVPRVVEPYRNWMARWPTLAELANARDAEVIKAWSSLGYNRRALNLLRTARTVSSHGGQITDDVRALRALPGIGEYTAAAVRSFAFGSRVVVIDTNVGRVIARANLGAFVTSEVPPAEIRAAAERVLPAAGAREHNLALMDLGAIVCRARNPDCICCPLATLCRWNVEGQVRTHVPNRKANVRFAESSRFARGRIVALLRDAPRLTEDDIRDGLTETHRSGLHGYLQALAKEGLIEAGPEGAWQLPQGNNNIASPKL